MLFHSYSFQSSLVSLKQVIQDKIANFLTSGRRQNNVQLFRHPFKAASCIVLVKSEKDRQKYIRKRSTITHEEINEAIPKQFRFGHASSNITE